MSQKDFILFTQAEGAEPQRQRGAVRTSKAGLPDWLGGIMGHNEIGKPCR